MTLRRLILLAVVLSGLVVSGGVIVVGLTYAIYALLEPRLGVAGAVAVMVGIVAILLGGAAAALWTMSRGKTVRRDKAVVAAAPPEPSPVAALIETLADTVRERPVVILLAAVSAGVLAIRNPIYLATALRAFTAPAPEPE